MTKDIEVLIIQQFCDKYIDKTTGMCGKNCPFLKESVRKNVSCVDLGFYDYEFLRDAAHKYEIGEDQMQESPAKNSNAIRTRNNKALQKMLATVHERYKSVIGTDDDEVLNDNE